MTFNGGCQCKNIRFKISSEPIVVYACHCSECRKQAASAFGISVWFPRKEFSITAGRLKFWRTTADSGNEKICAFCPQCGTRIYHAGGEDSDILSIKGGALDDMRGLHPIGHIWLKSALDWSVPAAETPHCCQRQPHSFDELIRAYSKRNKGYKL